MVIMFLRRDILSMILMRTEMLRGNGENGRANGRRLCSKLIESQMFIRELWLVGLQVMLLGFLATVSVNEYI